MTIYYSPDHKGLLPVLSEEEAQEELIRLYAWAWSQDILRRAGLPSEWDQESWATDRLSCGTSCCIAGKAFLDGGGKFSFPKDRDDDGETFTSHGKINDLIHVPIEEWATTWLGGRDVGHSNTIMEMFSADNSLSDIRNYIKQRTGVDPKKKIQMRARAHSRD